MNDLPEEMLSAYLDGELTPPERAQIEAILAERADWRQTLEGIKRLRTRLSELPRVHPRNDLWTLVAQRIEETDPGAKTSASTVAPQSIVTRLSTEKKFPTSKNGASNNGSSSGGASGWGRRRLAYTVAAWSALACCLLAMAIPFSRFGANGPNTNVVAMSADKKSDEVLARPGHLSRSIEPRSIEVPMPSAEPSSDGEVFSRLEATPSPEVVEVESEQIKKKDEAFALSDATDGPTSDAMARDGDFQDLNASEVWAPDYVVEPAIGNRSFVRVEEAISNAGLTLVIPIESSDATRYDDHQPNTFQEQKTELAAMGKIAQRSSESMILADGVASPGDRGAAAAPSDNAMPSDSAEAKERVEMAQRPIESATPANILFMYRLSCTPEQADKVVQLLMEGGGQHEGKVYALTEELEAAPEIDGKNWREVAPNNSRGVGAGGGALTDAAPPAPDFALKLAPNSSDDPMTDEHSRLQLDGPADGEKTAESLKPSDSNKTPESDVTEFFESKLHDSSTEDAKVTNGASSASRRFHSNQVDSFAKGNLKRAYKEDSLDAKDSVGNGAGEAWKLTTPQATRVLAVLELQSRGGEAEQDGSAGASGGKSYQSVELQKASPAQVREMQEDNGLRAGASPSAPTLAEQPSESAPSAPAERKNLEDRSLSYFSASNRDFARQDTAKRFRYQEVESSEELAQEKAGNVDASTKEQGQSGNGRSLGRRAYENRRMNIRSNYGLQQGNGYDGQVASQGRQLGPYLQNGDSRGRYQRQGNRIQSPQRAESIQNSSIVPPAKQDAATALGSLPKRLSEAPTENGPELVELLIVVRDPLKVPNQANMESTTEPAKEAEPKE